MNDKKFKINGFIVKKHDNHADNVLKAKEYLL